MALYRFGELSMKTGVVVSEYEQSDSSVRITQTTLDSLLEQDWTAMAS